MHHANERAKRRTGQIRRGGYRPCSRRCVLHVVCRMFALYVACCIRPLHSQPWQLPSVFAALALSAAAAPTGLALDCCAAPGGKTMALADYLGSGCGMPSDCPGAVD